MAPILDTDASEERWTQAQWRTFELWEKIEQKLKRKRTLWILATALACLGLSAVPIFMDQSPKWQTLEGSRRLALLMSEAKRQAALSHRAVRLDLSQGPAVPFAMKLVTRCDQSEGALLKEGVLLSGVRGTEAQLLLPETGASLGVPGLVTTFCYDSLNGYASAEPQASGDIDVPVGIGIIPVKDLSEGRLDRLSIVIVKGKSAEISFN